MPRTRAQLAEDCRRLGLGHGDIVMVHASVPVLRDGARVWLDCEEFDSSEGAHANWPERFFAQIVDAFIAKNDGTAACVSGKIGNAGSHVLDAKALIDFAVAAMIKTANAPRRADPTSA